MTKFTKKEISLCKQLAEKHRKKIGEGDWYISESSEYKTGWSSPMLNDNDYEPVKMKLTGIFDDKDRNDVPLWTISDCLEFLREKFERLRFCDDKKLEVQIWLPDGFYYHVGKTPLEACLKAVIEVLKNEKI